MTLLDSAQRTAPAPAPRTSGATRRRLGNWLLDSPERPDHETPPPPGAQPGPYAHPDAPRTRQPWWKVMCLTGVDYFSTLGYQPGIAAVAAGALAPVATLVLVALTLFGALPVYRRVAAESPHGQGSIRMLERLLPSWRGKILVLVLLGFAATDFMITITLSAADAAEHAVENPYLSGLLDGQNVAVTLVLVAMLGAVFLRGFREAIGLAVGLVVVFLGLNLVVLAVCFWQVAQDPSVMTRWSDTLMTQHSSPLAMIGIALLVFPKLALGMSGFETGVAVMSHVEGDPGDTERNPAGRIRNTRRLLLTAALIMSGYLVASSLVVTWLVPPAAVADGGPASGRALAYLAHLYLGNTFGTVYDASTIAILWFAGASAMAGLLNLVPRYLPRFGMAPEWTRATRPLVLVLTATAVAVTLAFKADVNAQGGAYATGVLVLFTSAGVAVTLAARRAGQRRLAAAFAVITLVFVYTTADNIVERPDGVKIAALFIAAIVAVSVVSRLRRALELRVTTLDLDVQARMFLRDCSRRTIRLVAHDPGRCGDADYRAKRDQVVLDNGLPDAGDLIFVEVTVSDPSDFAHAVQVRGEVVCGEFRVLRVTAPTVPNALAALLLHARDVTGVRPHIYFEWTEGNPVTQLLRFLLVGRGEVAPITREVLRRAEPTPSLRPHVHVG